MVSRSEDPDRDENETRFARVVHRHGLRNSSGWLDAGFRGLSQAAVAAEMKVSRPTVSALAQRANELLSEAATGVVFDPTKTGVAVGVDFGEAHHRVALADIHGQLFQAANPAEYETMAMAGPASLSLRWATERVAALLDEAGISQDRVCALGVSLPGPVNTRTGKLHASPHGTDRSWEIVEMQLPGLLSLPTATVESDYNASALTEHLWGATLDLSEAIYVKLSRRCACSLLVNHRIYRGADGLAGHLGKTRVVELDGSEGWVLVEEVFSLQTFRELVGEDLSPDEIVDRAASDAKLDAAMRRGARALGIALAPIIDALNPESVVIGGALGAASLAWVASDLVEGITALGSSAARDSISGRLGGATFRRSTAVRGAIASALLANAPKGLAGAMRPI
jgi:predicted NBD/HSP70 family sugar kinase